eukprot:PhF_6_TR33859/c1_g1_i4/m.49682
MIVLLIGFLCCFLIVPNEAHLHQSFGSRQHHQPTTTTSGLPKVVLPYTTTMLRTHHYRTQDYLSIYEQFSTRAFPWSTDGSFQEAYHIFPGFSFSMRDPNNTIINGIRVVYTYNVTARTKEVFYYITSVDN